MRLVSIVLVLAACAIAPASASAVKGFSFGVASGDVTSKSAMLWAHAKKSGGATLEVATDRKFKHVVATKDVKAKKSRDNTVQATVTKLSSGKRFFYRFRMGKSKSDVGQFETAPAANKAKTITFAWSGDADAQAAKGESEPFYNSLGDQNFLVYKQMAAEKNDFNINLGDTIYSDSEVGATVENGTFQNAIGAAITRKQKWAKYRQNLALRNLSNFRGAASLYSHPDDHEWINDFAQDESLTYIDGSGNERHVQGSKIYDAGVNAFRDYAPVGFSKANGFYRTFRWGRNVELFFLDERSFRDAKASENGQCDNPPGSGDPDLAPTAPQDTRSNFGILIPSLNNPPPAACVTAIHSPDRTFLGERQENAFYKAVKGSDAKWKVIVNEVPIQQLYELPYDRWEGYEAERIELLNFIKGNVKNVVFLTTDHHGNLVSVVRYKTLASDGGPINLTDRAGNPVYDFATGPVATMSFRREINGATCDPDDTSCDNGSLVDDLFFEPKPDAAGFPGLAMTPDNGVAGIGCSAIDVFSYGQVTVTSSKFKVELKDLNGDPVTEEDDPKPACGPFVLNAAN